MTPIGVTESVRKEPCGFPQRLFSLTKNIEHYLLLFRAYLLE
jgi:hypothetical protein